MEDEDAYACAIADVTLDLVVEDSVGRYTKSKNWFLSRRHSADDGKEAFGQPLIL